MYRENYFLATPLTQKHLFLPHPKPLNPLLQRKSLREFSQADFYRTRAARAEPNAPRLPILSATAPLKRVTEIWNATKGRFGGGKFQETDFDNKLIGQS